MMSAAAGGSTRRLRVTLKKASKIGQIDEKINTTTSNNLYDYNSRIVLISSSVWRKNNKKLVLLRDSKRLIF